LRSKFYRALVTMKISIITATYNCEKTVTSTLDSIATQTYPDVEHLIIDGQSSDNTLNLLSCWNAHTFILESSRDQGIYDALNKGIFKASGEVIGFLHADDVLQDEHVLEKIAKAFEDPTIQIVYGDLVYVTQEDLQHVVRTWHSGKFNSRKLRRGWMPPHPTFYARRSLYEQLGGFNLRYRIAADYDCMLRLLCQKSICIKYIPEILVRMRVGGISNRSLRNIIQKSLEDIDVARQNLGGGLVTVLLKNLSKLNQF